MKKILTILLVLIAIIVTSAIGVGYAVIWNVKQDMPNIEELITAYAPASPTSIYDRNGALIDTLYTEDRDLFPLSDVPEHTKEAFISIEDKKFYEHHGLNYFRILGAAVINFRSGRAIQGGSSITQQLSKIAFLSPEKTIKRKIKEAILSTEFERVYTKEEILERYLNEINFGSGAYGLKTAAKDFFHKDLSELILIESALLAGIPNRPEKYNPRKSLDAAIKRGHLVLREMLRDGRITEAEYNEALKYKFINEKDLKKSKEEKDAKDQKETKNKNDKKDNNVVEEKEIEIDDYTIIIFERHRRESYRNPEFTILVEQFLTKILDENLLYRGGLKVYTTFDLEIQKVAKEKFENYSLFKSYKKLQGGMITIDPHTGGIISLVAGRNYEVGNFNRATMSKKQYGSSFKPFVYFAALLNGYESNTVVEDSFVSYGKWAPKNYGGRFSNNTTLLSALDRSLNIVSVKLLDTIGIDYFKKIISDIEPDWYISDGLASSLGAVDGSPMQLAIAYSIFVNGGYKVSPLIVTSIEDRLGKVIFDAPPEKVKLFDSLDTSVMTYMLKSSVQRGTSSRARVYDRNKKPIEQGGKTGTTNSGVSVWYAGITPDYVTTAYLGYDDNKSISGSLTGGTAVGPLYRSFYQAIIDKGLYVPTRFSFLDDHLKNGDLMIKQVNLKSGLLGSGREAILRRGKIMVESNEKYKKGLVGFVNVDTNAGKIIPVVEDIPYSFDAPKNGDSKNIDLEEDDLFQKLLNGD